MVDCMVVTGASRSLHPSSSAATPLLPLHCVTNRSGVVQAMASLYVECPSSELRGKVRVLCECSDLLRVFGERRCSVPPLYGTVCVVRAPMEGPVATAVSCVRVCVCVFAWLVLCLPAVPSHRQPVSPLQSLLPAACGPGDRQRRQIFSGRRAGGVLQ